jgi:hypothetical protein
MIAPPLPPLRARNRLTETILAARHDSVARRVLVGLAGDDAAVSDWLGPDEARHRAAVVARARRASEALAAVPLRPASGALDEALDDAALLFDAGLFFETHELLEPHWRQASGDLREALQGLIQIAVGYQHHVNGNASGARSLLAEGVVRVRRGHLLGMSLDDFADAVARTSRQLGTDTGAPFAVAPFPRALPRGPGHAAQPSH